MFEVSTRVDLLSEDKIIKALTENSVERWAYIKHDKDVDEDGEPKNEHWHVMLYTKHATTASAVSKWFGVEEQQIEFIKSKYFADALIYLTHVLAEDKHEYSDEEVKAKEGYNWIAERDKRLEYRRKNPNKREVEELIEKALNGEIRGYHVGGPKLPANVYHSHMKAFDDAFTIFLRDIAPRNKKKRRVFFVTGESGNGKTTFATQYARDVLKKEYYYSDNNNDPFQNYAGQPVVILDDFRGENMSVTDLLKVLEQTGNPTAKARYRNKGLAAVEVIFITFPTPDYLEGKAPLPRVMNEIIPLPAEMKVFYEGFKGSQNETIKQFTRRVNFFVRTVFGGDSYIYVRINHGEEWELQGSFTNEFEFDQEDRKQDDIDFLKQTMSLPEFDGDLRSDEEVNEVERVKLYDENGKIKVPF